MSVRKCTYEEAEDSFYVMGWRAMQGWTEQYLGVKWTFGIQS